MGLKNVGLYNISLLYFTCSISGLGALPVYRFLGSASRSMIVSVIGFTIWIAGFLLPSYRYEFIQTHSKEEADALWYFTLDLLWVQNLFSALFIGFCTAVVWTCQGIYISECASHSNKGRFNSIFFAIYQTSQYVSYFIAAQLIQRVSKSTFFWVMIALAFASTIFFCLLRKPKNVEEQYRELELTQVP